MISPSVWSLDLQQSVLTALGRVEESKIVASQIRQGQNRIDEADAAYYPNLSVNIQTGTEFRTPGFIAGQTDDTFYSYRLRTTLDQHLFDGESRRFSLENSKLSLKATEFQAQSVLERVTFDVVTSYLNVVYVGEVVRTHKENLVDFQRISKQIDARAQGGALPTADAQQVKARVVGAEAALSRAQLELSEAEFSYTRLVGPVESDMSIPFEVPDIFFENYGLLLEKMRTQNTGLQQAKYNRRVALTDINISKAAFWPTISFQLLLQNENTFSGGQGEINQAGAFFNLNYNYNLGGATENSVDRAEERSKELFLLRQLLRRDSEITLQTAYSNYLSFKKVNRAIQLEIESNRKVLEAQLQQQRFGDVRVLDLVTAQERLNDARIRLLRSQLDEQLTRYQILQLIGEILTHFNSSG